MSTVSISTAQNIALDYSLASLGHRILATLIDGIIKISYILVLLFGLGLASNIEDSKLAPIFIILFLPLMFYSLLCELFLNGQSLGKKIMKTKVVSLNGEKANLGQYLMRWMFRLIDIYISTGAIALIVAAISDKSQRLGDMTANTIVISLNPPMQMSDTLYVPKVQNYNLQYPEVANLSAENLQLIKDVLLMQHRPEAAYMAQTITEKIEQILQIKSRQPPMHFLQTLIFDYNHLS